MSTEVKPDEKPDVDLVVVYMGVRLQGLGFDRERLYAYAILESPQGQVGETRKDENWFHKPLFKGAKPGSVWKTTGTPNGKSISVRGEPVGTYVNSDVAATWAALDRANRQEWDLHSEAAREARRVLDFACLEPIRRAYQTSSGTRQGLIMANAVRYITSHMRPVPESARPPKKGKRKK